MAGEELTDEQIRRRGLEALRRRLGVGGMMTFMQQFHPGKGDGAPEQQEWPDSLTAEEIYETLMAKRQKGTE